MLLFGRQPKQKESHKIIKKVGINPCVDVPERISKDFGIKGYIPIKGKINRKRFVQTLVPLGNGRHRLFINTYMRNEAKVDVGDKVEIVLEYDKQTRVVPIPKQLEEALKKNKKAEFAWKKLTKSKQKEILRYINSLKNIKSIERNIKKLFNHLLKK